MHHASITEPIAAPADEVWKAIADFGSWSWSGIDFESDGSGVGALRRVPLFPGTEVVERCEALDAATRTVGYTILEGNPFPADDYHATMQIEPAGDDACELRWSSTFETDADTDETRSALEDFYRGAAALLKAHFEPR